MNLHGRPIQLGMEVVGGKMSLMDSQVYKLKLLKQSGQPVEIEAYGIEKISSKIERVDIENVANILQVRTNQWGRD